ncbi:MAG: hypothetical protein R3C26_23260 [Calditrichia bacterium]
MVLLIGRFEAVKNIAVIIVSLRKNITAFDSGFNGAAGFVDVGAVRELAIVANFSKINKIAG